MPAGLGPEFVLPWPEVQPLLVAGLIEVLLTKESPIIHMMNRAARTIASLPRFGYKRKPVNETNHTTDVIIIGGGGAGWSTAMQLAMRGQRVMVLERQLLWAGGKTGRAAPVGAAGLNHRDQDWPTL